MTEGKNSDTIRMLLHPDALFDEGYQEPSFDISGYAPFDGTPELGDVSGARADVRCGSGTLRVEVCTADILRIRAVPGGGDFGKTVTESLDLVRVPGEEVAVAAEAHDSLLEISGGNLVCRIDPVSRDFAESCRISATTAAPTATATASYLLLTFQSLRFACANRVVTMPSDLNMLNMLIKSKSSQKSTNALISVQKQA